MSTTRHSVSVDLRFNIDVFFGGLLEPCNIDLDIEVTNIADDSILFHDTEMSTGNNISAAGRRNKDVSLRRCLLHGGHFEPCHCSLKGIDWVDFGDDDSRSV